MKKVCIVSMGYLWFPVEKGTSRFFQIANTYVQNGYEVEVITTDFQHFNKAKRDTKLILAQNYPFKITFIEGKPYKKNVSIRRAAANIGIAKRLTKYLEAHIEEYDAVYCSIPANNVAAATSKVCKAHGVPFIIDIEDLWPEAMLFVRNAFLRKVLLGSFHRDAEVAYANATAAIGTSEDYTARAVKYNHRTDLPMETVYVGCDLSDFDNGVKIHAQEIDKDENAFWVTYAGSISTSYDIKNVIDAVVLAQKEAVGEKRTIHLVMLGTGTEKEELERYVHESGYEDIAFWGFTPYPRMAAVLAKSDVVVNSFVKGAAQSIVNKVGDYLASGKPMLNTLENPVFCDIVTKNGIGINIEPGNPEKLKDAIMHYYHNREDAKRDGAAARKLAEERFDRATSYQKIVEVTTCAIDGKFC